MFNSMRYPGRGIFLRAARTHALMEEALPFTPSGKTVADMIYHESVPLNRCLNNLPFGEHFNF